MAKVCFLFLGLIAILGTVTVCHGQGGDERGLYHYKVKQGVIVVDKDHDAAREVRQDHQQAVLINPNFIPLEKRDEKRDEFDKYRASFYMRDARNAHELKGRITRRNYKETSEGEEGIQKRPHGHGHGPRYSQKTRKFELRKKVRPNKEAHMTRLHLEKNDDRKRQLAVSGVRPPKKAHMSRIHLEKNDDRKRQLAVSRGRPPKEARKPVAVTGVRPTKFVVHVAKDVKEEKDADVDLKKRESSREVAESQDNDGAGVQREERHELNERMSLRDLKRFIKSVAASRRDIPLYRKK